MTLTLRIVVMLRSYSRNTGSTSLEIETSASGMQLGEDGSATRRSCAGLA